MEEEVDEFGIPIKKVEQPEVDEFGIPIKKVDEFGIPVKPLPSKQEIIGTALEPFPAAKGVYDFGRTIYSGLTDTAPQTAAQTLEVARTALNPANVAEFIVNDKPVDFQRYVRDRDPKYSGISGFFTPFNMDEAIPKYGEQFMKDEGLSSEVSAMEERLPATIERRKKVEQFVQRQKQEAEEKLGGTVRDYRDINSVADFSSFVGNLLGQTAYQIPLSVGTRGASSYMMESATIYDAQLDRLAKEHGISREEVIERNLDNPAAGQAYAILAGGLDAASAGSIIGAFRKGGGTVLKKWLNTATETLTEPTQGVLEEIGSGGTLGEAFSEEGRARRVNELIGGFVGGGAFSLASSVKSDIRKAEAEIDQAIQETDTGDPQINADLDAVAQIDPVDKQVLEEVKVADAVQTEQKEVEAEEKLRKELSGEQTESKETEEKEIPVSQTPEYKEAVAKVEALQKKFAEMSIEENADELLFDLREARQALQKIAGKPKDTRKKTDIQKQIEDATGVTKPEKSVKMTPNEAIKHQVQTFFRGMDKGVKKGKELTNELVTKVQEAIKDSPLSAKQVSSILGRVKKTNLFTPGSISRLNSFIDKVTSDAEYADKLAEAKTINKKLRKLSKSSSSNLQNYKGLAKAFASINPEDTFINPHLEWANKILQALTSPTKPGYSPVDVAEAQAYVTDLQEKIAEYEEEQAVKGPDGEKRNVQLFATLRSSLEALNDKDLSEFDESEQKTINTLKALDPATLTDEQAVAVVRVIDNIVENDDFSNASAVEPVIESKKNLKEAAERFKGVERKELGTIGKIGANLYQQFTRIFGDSGIAAEIQRLSGILDVFNAGSRVENQEIKLTKTLKDKIKQLNKKYKTKVQDLNNQVRLVMFSELYKNYGDDSHIAKVKNNFVRTIAEYEKADPDLAKAWAKEYEAFKDINTIEEARAEIEKTPALFEVWRFFNERFSQDINPRLQRLSTDLYNEPYVEANNYSHTIQRLVSDTKGEQERFGQGGNRGRSKIKPDQAKTAITANRNLRQGWAYGSDFIEGQLRGYRESLYDIEVSKANALVSNTIYTPEFEKLVGGLENAKTIRSMVSRAEEIQQGMSRATANDAVKFLNSITQFIRNLGAIRALASLSQPIKQVPSVWVKSFFNHAGSGSIGMFFKGIGAVNLISTSPNLKKLFDQYSIGVRGERLGGIERGDSIGYRLSPGANKAGARAAEWLQRQSDHFGRIVLQPLTKSDVYAARTTWLSYYLQSLKEQGVTRVDLNSEFEKQNDPIRKTAAAFAEQMLAETQVPSNPATLAQIVRNENDGGWNFAKNLLIPFSTFSLTNKYRNISDVGKFIRNPNARNAGAVAGSAFEILAYSSVAYAMLPFYKDWLKAGIESLFGLESGDDDEEKKAANRKKSFYSNLINATVPFAVGSPAEAGIAVLSNKLAFIADNSGMTYQEWKKETGGFVFEPDAFDAGVFALGVEPFTESASGVINLFSDEVTYESFGQERSVTLTEEQKNLLALKTVMDLMAISGIGEADIYNQVKKIYKEQLRQGSSSTTPTTPNQRPRPLPRPRRIPARNLN